MTRAGEKLYGDWERTKPPERGLFATRSFWRGFLGMTLLLVVAAVALFGFG